MATPRRLLVDPAHSGVFHCVSRCVRRAFLCGRDAYSGRDFEHRRGWIRDRLRELTRLFAVEVHSYSVMSNHLHVVVRTLPQLVPGWGDEEVARRWLWLFPGRGGKAGQAPEEGAIRAFCLDRRKLETCRERLADLSWFMRCLNEQIAPLGLPEASGGTHWPRAEGVAGDAAPDAVVPPPLLSTMSVERYLELLDWTGRQIQSGKRGYLSAHLRPALERLDLDVARWVENVERFGGLFYRVAGTLRRLRQRAQAIGRASLHGHAGARRLYARTG